MRILYTILTLAAGGYGAFWAIDKNPDLKQKAEEILDFRTTCALETKFDASQIMDTHQRKLLKEKGAKFLAPELKFFPFILLEVKYCDPKNRTKEGLILWDLNDGEMVLDTKTWEKTHGFADCILSKAQMHEFMVLHALSEKGGTSDLESLQNRLVMESALLDIAIQNCLKKNLILLTSQNKYRLHLENPKLPAIPETKLYEQLTTRSHKRVERASPHFSASEIKKTAKMAFGKNFLIRTATQIYLPIHRIVVQKTDGSIHTFHFNALTGHELPKVAFYQ